MTAHDKLYGGGGFFTTAVVRIGATSQDYGVEDESSCDGPES